MLGCFRADEYLHLMGFLDRIPQKKEFPLADVHGLCPIYIYGSLLK